LANRFLVAWHAACRLQPENFRETSVLIAMAVLSHFISNHGETVIAAETGKKLPV
jgi:hypothetical protein